MRKPDSRLYDSNYDDAIRAADADREAAEARLRAHHLEGRLGDDELADRLTRCQSAKTMGELRALLVDLPGERPAEAGPRAGWRGGWLGVPLVPALLALALLFALFGSHAGWHHGYYGWHHGYGWHHHAYHGFPWFPLLLVFAVLFAVRRRRWCGRAG
ncbi:MAG TPA: DUF1707 domain-containing protein [Gemmatimonadaceae bacterium]